MDLLVHGWSGVPPGTLALAFAVSVAVPLAFLLVVRRLDLYASAGFGVVVSCFVWGLVAFAVSFAGNTSAVGLVSFVTVTVLVAPIIEEIAKSLILVYYVRRPEFTYFVDGAIFGFAAGTGFAVIENLFKLTQSGVPLAVGINRAFSTSLMHGTTSALVGVSLGRLRFGRGWSRLGSLLLGWSGAMALHVAYNSLARESAHTLVLGSLWLIGLGGVALTAALIGWGLAEERSWLREMLGLEVGVSQQESAVVQRMADLDELLAPFEARFGREKRRLVGAFLLCQAQLGLKRKVHQLTTDERLRSALATEMAELTQQMDTIRREVGVYCMAYVRTILPTSDESLWSHLEVALANAPSGVVNVWEVLGGRLGPGNESEGGSAGKSPAAPSS